MNARRYRLLLAESNPGNRRRVHAILEREQSIPCIIDEAPDGETLIRLLGAGREYDLIMTAPALEGFQGHDLMERIRQMLPEVPVIVLAHPEETALVHEMLQSGATCFAPQTGDYLDLLPLIAQAALDRTDSERSTRERLARQQHREEAAKEGEEYFRALIAHASDVITVLTRDGTIRYASPSAEKVLGYPPESLIGRNASDFMHPADTPTFGEAFADLIRHPGASEPFETRLRHRDGSWRIMEGVAANLLENPAVKGIVINVRDITSRKQAEAALQESEERFKRIAENAPDMIFRWSYARGFEYVSPASTEVVGYTPEEHYADPGLGYRNIHIDDIPIYESVFSDLANPEGPRRYCVIRWIHKDGHIKHIEMRMTPIFDRRGDLIAIEGIARDISQHVIARERLRELTARLTHAHEQERRRVAHELHDEIGQALTVAKMRLRMAENSLPEDATATREKLATLGKLLDETLQNVRALSHELRPPLLDEMGWEPALAWLCDSFSQRTGLPVLYHHTGGSDRLDGDVELVAYRVVQEALTNVARHAGAEEVRVTTSLTPAGLEIVIEDNGRGFNLAALNSGHSFQAGLGLLGMQERVDSVGGQLEIQSEPGHGTRVRINLPCKEPER